MVTPLPQPPEAIAKVDALIEWLDAAPIISTTKVKALRKSFHVSARIDWIQIRKARITLDEAVANGRTDLIGERMLIALRKRPNAPITRGYLESINTAPWPVTDIYDSPQDEFKRRLRMIDNDLEIQCDFVRTFFARHWQIGLTGISHYVWRVAVLLRRAGELERELRFLQAVCRHKSAFVCPEHRMMKLAARLEGDTGAK